MEINFDYTLADQVVLEVRATVVVDKDGEPQIDEFAIFNGSEQTDISKLMVFQFANVHPIPVETAIEELIWDKYAIEARKRNNEV